MYGRRSSSLMPKPMPMVPKPPQRRIISAIRTSWQGRPLSTNQVDRFRTNPVTSFFAQTQQVLRPPSSKQRSHLRNAQLPQEFFKLEKPLTIKPTDDYWRRRQSHDFENKNQQSPTNFDIFAELKDLNGPVHESSGKDVKQANKRTRPQSATVNKLLEFQNTELE